MTMAAQSTNARRPAFFIYSKMGFADDGGPGSESGAGATDTTPG